VRRQRPLEIARRPPELDPGPHGRRRRPHEGRLRAGLAGEQLEAGHRVRLGAAEVVAAQADRRPAA
jgi:hypothetical protein